MSQPTEKSPTSGLTNPNGEPPGAERQRTRLPLAATASPTFTNRRMAAKALAVASVVTLLFAGARLWGRAEKIDSDDITAVVTRANLVITVTERGELESAKTEDVRCEVEGREGKIVEILPEGTSVCKGQVVVRFDTAEMTRKLAEQVIKVKQAEAKAETARQELEVAKNKADGEVAKAKLTLTLAELDLEKYLEGEYQVEEDDLKGQIALNEAALEDDKSVVEYYRKLVKKGFRTPEQLRAKEQSAERSSYYLNREKGKLAVLQKYKKKRQEVELAAKAEDAKRDLERTKSSGAASVTKADTDYQAAVETARLEKAQQEKMEKELEKAEVRAPQDGILVYPNERYWDESYRIRVGAVVHFQQKLFSLPDLTRMQVKVKIHEAMVKKVKQGQNAEIRIDAYPNLLLHGPVEKIGTLADSRYWDERGVKEYETIVKIEELPDVELKPGMTAEVKVLVDEIEDVLLVPVEAVTESEGQHYAYVVGPAGAEQRQVSIGENNTKHVEIKEGLGEGDAVALNARARMAEELKSNKKGGQRIED